MSKEPHSCELQSVPKGARVFVVLRMDWTYEETETWIAGVFLDRSRAVAALGEKRGTVLAIPLNEIGRYARISA